MNQTTQQSPTSIKKPSGRASITGGVLAGIGWAVSGIGSLLIHADYHSKQTLTTTAQKVDDNVGNGTMHVLSVLIGVPFLVIGIVLAGLAIVFTIIRLRKVGSAGLIVSLLWLFLAAWSIQMVISSFSAISAHAS